jgi:hypothetical protein
MENYCSICGKRLKKGKQHTTCFPCGCTKDLIKRGEHSSSTKKVKALKQIEKHGVGWFSNLFISR